MNQAAPIDTGAIAASTHSNGRRARPIAANDTPAITIAITHSFNENRDYYVAPDEVAKTEDKYLEQLPSQA